VADEGVEPLFLFHLDREAPVVVNGAVAEESAVDEDAVFVVEVKKPSVPVSKLYVVPCIVTVSTA
jgi:hypothetical protein